MKHVLIVGAGPAGLMAAQVLSQAGIAVSVFDAMPSAGRKFLLAGKGGLNLTHSEPANMFVSRYGPRRAQMERLFKTFDATSVRNWAASLGIETFVGSSGRVFPADMKAAPLLRAWLARLRHCPDVPPVTFFMRHRWVGWHQVSADQALELDFETPGGLVRVSADAVVLALGGGSWGPAWAPMARGFLCCRPRA